MKTLLTIISGLCLINIEIVFSQPGNDACANAILITSDDCSFKTGTLQNATQSTGAISCNGSTSSSAFDVWYKFVATSTSHKIIVSPCANLDAVVDLRMGSCLGTNINCADHGGGVGRPEVINHTSFVIGNTYYIRVYASPGPIPSNPCFDIFVITSNAISNDNCSGAITLTPNSSCNPTSGNIGGAMSSGLSKATCDICISPNPHLEDVWYKFTATASASYTITATPSSCSSVYGFDPVIDLYSSCPSSASQSMACMDNGGGVGKAEVLTFSATQGTTYYIRLYDCGLLQPVDPTYNICVTTSCTAVSNGSTQPQNQTLAAGSTATFSVSVNGTPPFSYFWYKNGIFTNVSTLNTNSTSNSYTTPALIYPNDNGSTYYCLINNCSDTKQAQSNTATIIVTSGCTAPNVPNIASASNITNVSFTANWSLIADATTYFIDVSTTSSFSNIVYNNINTGNTTSYNFSNLICNSNYYYRVRANNICGTSTNSSSTSLLTSACCTAPANPLNPTKNNPTCGNVTLTRSNPPSGITYYWQGTSCGTSTNLGSGTTFQATTSDNYYIRAFNNAGNCWSAGCGSIAVTISSGPSVTASSNSPTNAPINAPSALNLFATNVLNATYSWTGPNGYISNSQNPVRNPSNVNMSGQYCVTATLSNCASTACANVTVNIPPAPTVNSFIGTNVISNNPNIDANYTFYIDNSPTINNIFPIKICADGTTSSYFKVDVSNVAEINFQILSEDEQTILADAQMGTFTDEEKYGKLGLPYSYGNNVEIAYTHPHYMDENGIARHLKLRVLKGQNPITGVKFLLDIYRAPVLMVHGWLGNRGAFTEMENSLYYSTHPYSILHRVDYKSTNDESFLDNINVVPIGIRELITKFRSTGYSAGKVDIIAHSMGGILSRLYLQSNTYNNDIHKLITANTPHSGSQGANYSLFTPCLGVSIYNFLVKNNIECISPVENGPLGINFSFEALFDMKVNSKGIRELLNGPSTLNGGPSGKKVVPSFSISTEDIFILDSDCGQVGIYLFANSGILGPTFVNSIYNFESNDVVVARSSQIGGLTRTAHINNQCHMSSVANVDVINLVKGLLDKPANSLYFDTDGFNPVKLESVYFIPPNSIQSLSGSLKIVEPTNNSVYPEGNIVHLKISGSNEIKKITFGIGNSVVPNYFKQIIGSSLETDYTIPKNSNGEIRIICEGYDSLNTPISFDTLRIKTTFNANIDSISVYSDKLLIPLNKNSLLNVSGYFNDNVIRDISEHDSIHFSILDTTIATNTNGNKFYGKAIGNTQLKITFKDKELFLPVEVYYLEPVTSSIFSANKRTICSNSSISFNDLSIGQIAQAKWILKGGIPNSSQGINPIINYNTPGQYDVTLISTFHDKKDTLTIPNYITVLTSPLVDIGPAKIMPTCSTTLDAGNPGATYLWNNGQTTRKIYPNQSGKYFVTVTNENGCKATDSIEVVLTDNIKPKVFTQNTFAYLNSSGQVQITPEMINKGLTDNCGIGSMTVSPNTFTCKNRGPNQVTLSVTDLKGNISTALATVNVIDLEAPSLTCPPNIIVTAKAGQCTVPGAKVPLGNPTLISDNCSIKYPLTKNTIANYPVGVSNIIWTVTDSSLNTKTCTQLVTILPTTCGVPTGVSYYDTTSTSAKIKWLSVSCATDYQLSIRQELTPGVWGSWTENIKPSGPGLIHLFTGLNPGKRYNYQLKSNCGTVFSSSYNGYFRTKTSGLLDPGTRIKENEKTNHDDINPSVTIIPNPASDNTKILINGFNTQTKEVYMYDLGGRLVFKVELEADENQIELELNTLSTRSGVYIIRVTDGITVRTEQMVIQR